MSNVKEEMVTQTYLLENGWTKSMIQNLLPAPVLKTNPYYRSAAPMKLWKKETVIQIMQTEEFANGAKKAENRKKTSLKVAQKKKEKLLDDTEKLLEKLTVKVIPETALVQRVLEEKKSWAEFHEFTPPDDDETMDRWIVNYIRHHLVKYDNNVERLKGKVGKFDAYVLFKNGVLSKIAEKYPQYAEECERQKKKLADMSSYFS